MEPEKPENQPASPAPETPVTPPETPQTPPAEPTTPSTPPPMPMSGAVVGGSGMGAAPAAKGGMKKNMLLAVIVGALLVLAGGAYAVYAYVTNTPDYLLNQAANQFWSNQTAMAAKLKITANQGGTDVSFNGDFAFQVDPSNTKNGEVVVGIGSGSSRISLTAEVFDEVMYLKFGDLQNLGGLAQSFGGDAASIYGSPQFLSYISKLNDKWWSISKQELQAFAKSADANATVSGSVSADDAKKLIAIYNKHQFFRPDKVTADQVVDGVNSAHFTLKVDKDQLKAFLTELKTANLPTFPVTDEDLKSADKAASDSSQMTIDVWIARDSKKLKQIQLAGGETGSKVTVTVTFETNLPKLDKIQKPTDSQPLSTLMQTLFGTSSDLMGGSSF